MSAFAARDHGTHAASSALDAVSDALSNRLTEERIAQMIADEARAALCADCVTVGLAHAPEAPPVVFATARRHLRAVPASPTASAVVQIVHEGQYLGRLEAKFTNGRDDTKVRLEPVAARGAAALAALRRQASESAEREFIVNAAHDIRTPLTVIAGAVDALRNGAKDDPQARDRFLGHLAAEAGRLNRLTDALLSLSRAQAIGATPQVARVPLRPLLDELAASAVCAESNVVINCPNELRAVTNRGLMESALANLVGNAIRHGGPGLVRIAARAVRRAIVVEISDDGPGVPPELRERITERFVRNAPERCKGFGLGLAIARQCIEALGGTFELESVAGHGTTVRIVLPEART